jgi:hypothetical protein
LHTGLAMKEKHCESLPGDDQRCDHDSRRVIRLRWPYAEANIIRARLVTENGNRFDVSPLYSIAAGWAFSICRECAKRGAVALDSRGALAIYDVMRAGRWPCAALGVPAAVVVALGVGISAIEWPLALLAFAVTVLTLGIFTISRLLTTPYPVEIVAGG